uniref:Uncharacterized protein n=1 Tax=Rhizochromulina marina TaxID=1034831 RepID=A0A7S2RNK5_9STRA|mmetsp:Transcript_18841/g.54837  ORF Transcript_18841/g.54837 Transcript_18841/m.54837 type:complete len:374 (+) Transcript_18841:53-1174(+)
MQDPAGRRAFEARGRMQVHEADRRHEGLREGADTGPPRQSSVPLSAPQNKFHGKRTFHDAFPRCQDPGWPGPDGSLPVPAPLPWPLHVPLPSPDWWYHDTEMPIWCQTYDLERLPHHHHHHPLSALFPTPPPPVHIIPPPRRRRQEQGEEGGEEEEQGGEAPLRVRRQQKQCRRRHQVEPQPLLQGPFDASGYQLAEPLSPALEKRVQESGPGFLDNLGFGDWTHKLDPQDPRDRSLIVELLNRLYNRPQDGFFIYEIFKGGHLSSEPKSMCDSYLSQLLTMARFRIVAFASPKPGSEDKFYVCYDTPELYHAIPGYFAPERKTRGLNGTGGGRKRAKGAPRDFIEGVHYFRSRAKLLEYLRRHGAQHQQQGR